MRVPPWCSPRSTMQSPTTRSMAWPRGHRPVGAIARRPRSADVRRDRPQRAHREGDDGFRSPRRPHVGRAEPRGKRAAGSAIRSRPIAPRRVKRASPLAGLLFFGGANAFQGLREAPEQARPDERSHRRVRVRGGCCRTTCHRGSRSSATMSTHRCRQSSHHHRCHRDTHRTMAVSRSLLYQARA